MPMTTRLKERVDSRWPCFALLAFCFASFYFYSYLFDKESSATSEPITYNLLEDTLDLLDSLPDGACTLDYANAHRLQQDNPCVLQLIRMSFLHKPFPRDEPYLINKTTKREPSGGQVTAVMRLTRRQSEGFFVEAGASNGEFLSNSLYLERYKSWTGLLIEPDLSSYNSMLTRKRKAWQSQTCLSLENYPTEVQFMPGFLTGKIHEQSSWLGSNDKLITVQCFPFYSLLLACGRTSVDFFSLDVEGHELKVLKTIPWHKVDIKIVAVERRKLKEGDEDAIVNLMEQNGFVSYGKISTPGAHDLVFIQDFLKDLRYLRDHDYPPPELT